MMNLKEFIKDKEARKNINKLKCFSATMCLYILHYPTLVFTVGEKSSLFVFPGSPRRSVFKIRDYKKYVLKTLKRRKGSDYKKYSFKYPFELDGLSVNKILTKRDDRITLTEGELTSLMEYRQFECWLESNNLLNSNGNIKKNLWSDVSR